MLKSDFKQSNFSVKSILSVPYSIKKASKFIVLYLKPIGDAFQHFIISLYIIHLGNFRSRVSEQISNLLTQYTYDANNDALLSVSSGGVTNRYSYSNDLLQSINVNDHLQYKFAYDHFGKTTANYVGNGTNWRTLSTIQYNDAGLMTKQTYGNGDYIEFSYDNLDRQTQTRYNGNNSQRVTYSYGNNGSVAQITDYYTNTNTRFVYDLADRVVSQREYTGTAMSGGTLRSYTDFTYASKTNYLTGIRHYSPLGTQNIGYRYGTISKGEMPDQIYGVTWNGAEKVSYTYDPLGRLTNRKIGSFNNAYTYEDVGTDKTTTLVKSVSTPAGTYSYTYDNIGNILSITDGTYTSSYEYDSLNQLVRANDERAGKTYTYSYSNGNITEMNEYAYTTGELGEAVNTQTWQYGDGVWSDLVTQFNGYTITYDEIGNPVSVDNRELSWRGRQLTQITDGENEISYAYNGDGQRVSKTVNGEKTEYIYNGDILAGQKTGNTVLVFMYDNNGDPFGFVYSGTEYYYVKNVQNDVTAIASADGTIIANYYYDPWGRLIEITGDSAIAYLNPIRYRSYYYDSETELYYLNSRYYSPDLCRFMNADGYIQTGQGILDKNMFAYCENNPVNKVDINGTNPAAVVYIAFVVIIYGIAIACVSSAVITALVPVLQEGAASLYDSISGSIDNAKDKSKERSKSPSIDNKRKQNYFPINPYDFKPKGLVMKEYPGTKNGRIIEWTDPVSGKNVFEWNEDFRQGSHYHALLIEWDNKHKGPHYYPGSPIPEPWNSIYFGE